MVNYVRSFINWGARGGAKVALNELGWPNQLGAQDVAQWNRANVEVLRLCNRRGTGAICWDTGEMRHLYPFSPWQPTTNFSPLTTAAANARPWEAFYRGATSPLAGAYLNTASQNAVWGNESNTSGSGSFKQFFSNVNRGSKGVDYAWDSATSMGYLYGRGIRMVVVGFRWERLQPTLLAAFNGTYQTDLLATVDAAIAAGLKVVIQPFNKGAYYVDNGGSPSYGVRNRIANTSDGTTVTNAAFNDLWTKLVGFCSSRPGVIAYGLMNEPSTGSQALWEGTTQSAVNTIRALGDTRTIMCSVLTYQHAGNVPTAHPAPWLTDSANNIVYSHSVYWDNGDYTDTYDTVSADAESGWNFLDTFTAADGTIASGARYGDVGFQRAWTTSTVRIATNQLAPDATTGNGAINRPSEMYNGKLQAMIATWDTTTSGHELYLYFRQAWNTTFDWWRFGLRGTSWYLEKRVAGAAAATVATATTASTVAPATNQLLAVDLDGPVMTCSVGGVQLFRVSDTFLQGCAEVGLTFVNSPSARVDWIGHGQNYHPQGLYS